MTATITCPQCGGKGRLEAQGHVTRGCPVCLGVHPVAVRDVLLAGWPIVVLEEILTKEYGPDATAVMLEEARGAAAITLLTEDE